MKQRIVNDSFWTDPYIEELDPSEKLLFLYLLTNPLCNIAWFYEIRIKRIAYETWFDKDMIDKMLNRFVEDWKLYRIDDFILMKNFAKNQSMNPSVSKGMQRVLDKIPIYIWEKLEKLYTGSIQALPYFTLLNLTIPNSTTPNSTWLNENSCEFSETDSEESETPKSDLIINKKENITLKELADEFFTTDFLRELLEKYKISAEELKSEITIFAWYWTEKSKNWKKERWQMEKSFDIRLRLYRWLNNNNKWSKDSSWNFEKNNWIILVPDNF